MATMQSHIAALISAIGSDVKSLQTQISSIPAGLDEPMGIAVKNDVTLNLNQSTRVVTVSPTVTSFTYWWKGVKTVVSTPKTVTLPNTTGTHFVYFDDATGTLKQSTTAWDIANTVQVCAVYWNATTGAGILLDERHGITMDWATHLRLHEIEGTKVVSGFAISSYTLSPSSPANSDNDFAVASGVIADEDLKTNVPALNSGADAYRVWYRSGASGDWTWDTTTYPFTVGTSYIHYNQWTGATWQKTEAQTNRYINVWVCATPSLTTMHGIIVVMGQAMYSSLALAEAEQIGNAVSWGNLPFPEIAPLYQVTLQTSSSYTTTGKTRIVSVNNIMASRVTVNYATSPATAAAVGLDVGLFDGLLTSADSNVQTAFETLDNHDHTAMVHLAGTETITGAKTFVRPSDAAPGLIAKKNSAASTGDLFQTQSEAGAVLAYIDGTGYLAAAKGAIVKPAATGSTGLVVQGLASQTGALQVWKNSSDATLSSITKDGALLTPASASGSAGLRLPHGAAPSSPTDGDIWTTTAGLYIRINGVTKGPFPDLTTDMGAWTTWTPALTASTTNPTLGTGSTATGRYIKVGRFMFGWFNIVFGSSGVDPGSGTYYISIPGGVNINSNYQGNVSLGQVCLSDSSTGSGGWVNLVSNYTNMAVRYATTPPFSGTTYAAATTPWTWAASDSLRGSFVYETHS